MHAKARALPVARWGHGDRAPAPAAAGASTVPQSGSAAARKSRANGHPPARFRLAGQTGPAPAGRPHLLHPHALRPGFTLEEIFNLTKIDRWFLVQIKGIVDFEEELAGAKN